MGLSVPVSYPFRIRPQKLLSLSFVERAQNKQPWKSKISSSFFLPSSATTTTTTTNSRMQTSSIPPSMALCISHGGSGGTAISKTHHLSLIPHLLNNPSSVSIFSLTNRRSSSHVTAAKKYRPYGRNKKDGRGGMNTTTKEDEILEKERSERDAEEAKNRVVSEGGIEIDDGYFLPELPGDKPDFWEGTQWDGFGFFIQYLWAFGIVFAVVACGIAVTSYNEGASDFKKTPVFQEAIQSRELLEEPETSESDVFEGNPTEEVPSLE